MPALPTPDVLVAKAIVTKEIAPPAAPAARSNEAVVKSMQERVDKGQWRSATELGSKPQADRKKTGEVIEQITDAGKKTIAKNAEALAFKFFDKGYSGMTPVEQSNLAQKLLLAARNRPAFAMELTGLNNAEQTAWALKKLQDPRFVTELGQNLQALGERGKLEDAVTKALQDVEDKQLEITNKQAEIDDVDRRLTPVMKRLAEFTPVAPGVLPTNKGNRLEDLQHNQATLTTGLEAAKRDKKRAEDALTRLRADEARTLTFVTRNPTAALPAGMDDIGTIRGQITTEEGNRTSAEIAETDSQKQLQELNALVAEKQQYEEQQDALNKEKQKLEAEKKKLELEKTRLDKIKTAAEILRTSQEEDITAGFENIFAESTNGLLDKDVQIYSEAADAELEKLKKEAEDHNPDEAAMYDALQNAWLQQEKTRGIFRKEKYRPINKRAVDVSYNTLLTEGPKGVMRDLLRGRINPATGILYQDPEIDALMGNKEYVEKMQSEVVKQLLANRIFSGGIGIEDARIIGMSKWGQGMIDQALVMHGDHLKTIAGLAGAGALGGPGLIERMGREVGRKPWLLLLLLGILPISAFAGPLVGVAAGGAATLGALGSAANSESSRFSHDLAA